MTPLSLIVQLLILAFFLSINNFAVAVGMGFSRIWSRVRWRIALVFGFFDFIAPIAGALMGNFAATVFGAIVGILGVSALFILGGYLIYDGAMKHGKKHHAKKGDRYHSLLDRAMASMWAVAAIAFGVSIDSFIVGFGLGTLQTSIFSIALVFGIVTFGMAIAGIIAGSVIRNEMDLRIAHIAGRSRMVAGIVFIFIALWKLFEI